MESGGLLVRPSAAPSRGRGRAVGVLTILYTTDLHNRLTPDKARRLHETCTHHSPDLVLDAGDAVSAGNFYLRPGGEPVFGLMATVPYDAMCLGNREFLFRKRLLQRKLAGCPHPILCANLATGSPLNPIRPHVQFRTPAGLRVCVLGLTVPMITSRMRIRVISDLRFEDPVDCARQLIPALRQESDVVVALTHLGLQRDKALLQEVNGIDLVLGGHDHQVCFPPVCVGNGWLIHGEKWARSAVLVRLDTNAHPPQLEAEQIAL